MSKIDRKIRELRRRHNLTQGEFAEAIGVKQSTVSRWESGAQEPEFNALLKMAEMAGVDASKFALEEPHEFTTRYDGPNVRVVGAIKADEWSESHLFDFEDSIDVSIPLPRDFIHTGIQGFVIRDNSCEPRYPEHSIVFINISKGHILHESYVVVVRKSKEGLYETTLREVYVNKVGVVYLSPVTDDPSILMPIRVKDPKHDISDGYVEVDASCILGPVIASFVMEPGTILPF